MAVTETVEHFLDDAERKLRELGAWDNSLQAVPAGAVRTLVENIRAAHSHALAVIAALERENFALAAGQCIVDGGLCADEGGTPYCSLVPPRRVRGNR